MSSAAQLSNGKSSLEDLESTDKTVFREEGAFMTKKQEQLLGLLREFDAVCRKHGLRYVMAGGSLIGVMRNEGFIPWDDDIDVYMPLADWERMKALPKEEFPFQRTLVSVELDRRYTNTFPRYGSTDTCAIHKHQLIADDIAGEIIDVLVLDPIPDDRAYIRYRKDMMIYSELININSVFCSRYELPLFDFFFYRFLYKVLGRDRTLRLLERKMFACEEERCDRVAMRWGGCPFLFEKDMFFPVKEASFEGLRVMIPRRTSDYLIWHYGDEWADVPPHKERESHEAVCVEGMDYQTFRKSYQPLLDKEKIWRDQMKYKAYRIRTAKHRHRLENEKLRLAALCVTMDLDKRAAETGESLSSLTEKKDFGTLSYIFAEYYRVQLGAFFIGREDYANIYRFYHPYVIDLDPDVFQAAVTTLFFTEKLAKAKRLTDVWKEKHSLNEELIKMDEAITKHREALNEQEQSMTQKAVQLVEELLSEFPYHPSFSKTRLQLYRDTDGKITCEEGIKFLKACRKRFPDDGYFLKYEADLIWQRKGMESALPVYAKAMEQTKNGIIWKEIRNQLIDIARQRSRELQLLLKDEKHKKDARRERKLWKKIYPGEETDFIFGSPTAEAAKSSSEDNA